MRLGDKVPWVMYLGHLNVIHTGLYSYRGEYFFFFWKFYPMPNHDIKNSTLASKVMFWTLPLIKCKTHQIWPTLKWKSWFFRFFSSFFTKNPCFPDKFYPSKKNPRNYNPMHIDIFFKIFTPAYIRTISTTRFFLLLDVSSALTICTISTSF